MPIFRGVVVDFPSVMALYSLTKREAGARVDQATVSHRRASSLVRSYGSGGLVPGTEYRKAVQAESDAKAALQEACLASALVQDMDFRRELTELKQCWERFRMHVTSARDDQFLGNLMLGEGTEHGDALRAAWKAIGISILRIQATITSPSALVLR